MIRRFLDVSGGHISPETWEWLDSQFADHSLRAPENSTSALLAGGKTRYGWFVFCPEEHTDELPQDLRRVLAGARRRGAEYVLFDCDAIPLEDLPILHPDFQDSPAIPEPPR